MSAGAFSLARYEVTTSVAGPPAIPAVVTSIRVQPETLTLAFGTITNASSTLALSPGYPRAVVSASSRRRGIIRARGVRIRFTATPPTGYKPGVIIFLPWLVISTFNQLTPGLAGTYLTVAVELLSTRSGSVT